jgi:hypothetical protein
MRFVQSCLFAELGRVNIYPSEATACSVGAPSSKQLILKRQVRVPSSLSSPRPQLHGTMSSLNQICSFQLDWTRQFVPDQRFDRATGNVKVSRYNRAFHICSSQPMLLLHILEIHEMVILAKLRDLLRVSNSLTCN